MKVIIVEDEKLSADFLISLLKRIDREIVIVDVFETVKQSVEAFQQSIPCDLLFVDIHLADGISFEIFSQVNIEIPVIFTTAYDEYAIKAFKLNSVDYLLKPINIDELKGALEKHKKIKTGYRTNFIDDLTSAYQSLNKSFKNRFIVKIGDSISTIKAEDIAYFISEDGLVLLVSTNGKRFPIDYNLDTLEELIDPDFFFRMNRKVIIHINSVVKVNTYFNSRLKINLPSLMDEEAVISRERVSDFKKWLDK